MMNFGLREIISRRLMGVLLF